MKKTVLIIAMIAGVSFGGIPIQWDVKVGYDQRFNESSPVAYNITAMRGETLDLMPRYMASGYPFSIASNADVRIYLREYGTTNAFTVSSTSGTVYTTSSQLGRVRAVLLPSDIPATGTNQFFVGVESSGMVYRAYGKLTVLDSPGVIASTNQIAHGVFDSSMFTFSNSHLAPWSLSDIGNYCGVQSVNGLTGVVSITAASLGALTNVPPQSYTIITNAPWLSDFSTMTPADIFAAGGVTNAGTDHATLSNLTWSASGHSGTPARLAGFFEGGMAGYSYLGAGLYFGGSDELSVSNDIIAGAALGATAVQAESDPVATPLLLAHTNNLANPHGVTAAQLGALTNETDTAALAALAEHAAYWPPNATASSWFTYTTNANEITITGYTGPNDVVIPDYINGWPVTEIGENAFEGSDVTSVGGAGNVVTVGAYAFDYCYSLTSVSLPQVQTVGDSAFANCPSLASVSLPQVQTVGNYVFYYCHSLTSVSLPQVQTVGDYAFVGCGGLTSLYFDNDAPTIGADIFADITPNQVTNYVTNPQATGWGATLGGMPVVRLPLYADAIYQAGELVATTQHVAQAIAAIPIPGAGCTDLGASTLITGATTAYRAAPTAAYTLAITNTAPRYTYSMRVLATNAYSLASGLFQDAAITPTGTNVFVFVPDTGTVWRVYGRAL